MKTYIIKYKIEEEIEALSEIDALIQHQDYLAEKLGSMLEEIVTEKGGALSGRDEAMDRYNKKLLDKLKTLNTKGR